MILDKIGYAYNDVTIVPSVKSFIKSRSNVDPFTNDHNLPIFTAPMSTVVNCENFELWEINKVTPILPRNIDWDIRLKYLKNFKWVAISLSEFNTIIDMFDSGELKICENHSYKICIDVANGHMHHLLQMCKKIKYQYGDFIKLMTGNIANPDSIGEYIDAKIDYVRVGIGTGAGCTTSSNTAIHYPQASLLNDINESYSKNKKIKIIADGGIRNFSDVIKALALGADYVMIGGLFSSFLESAGNISCLDSYCNFENGILKWKILFNTTRKNSENWLNSFAKQYEEEFKQYANIEETSNKLYNLSINLPICDKAFPEHLKRHLITYCEFNKEFYGMSTKRAQELIKPGSVKRTAEGISKKFTVKYTIKQWIDNMEAYLRSAMSYCGSHDLSAFIGKQTLIINSVSEINAVNK